MHIENIKFDEDSLTIDFMYEDNIIYQLDLERCKTSSELLDWILQINDKSWCTPNVLKELFRILDEASNIVFYDSIQMIYCPFGNNKHVDWTNGKVEDLICKSKSSQEQQIQ
jgi:hypothetical protein